MSDGSDLVDQAIVTHDESQHRFEIAIDGRRVGVADYRDAGGRRHFTHTEVTPAYGGRGVAGVLVDHALRETRAAGLRVVPLCSYVAMYIKRHEEFADLVD